MGSNKSRLNSCKSESFLRQPFTKPQDPLRSTVSQPLATNRNKTFAKVARSRTGPSKDQIKSKNSEGTAFPLNLSPKARSISSRDHLGMCRLKNSREDRCAPPCCAG